MILQGSDTRCRRYPVSRGRGGLGVCPTPKAMGFSQTTFEDTAPKYASQPNRSDPVSRNRLSPFAAMRAKVPSLLNRHLLPKIMLSTESSESEK